MKIFITGVAGFLGSNLANYMLNLGHEVIGIDNLVGGFRANVRKEVEFYECDCLDMDKMVAFTKNCDVVFHAACTAHEGVSVFSPNYITLNTFQATMSILSASIQNKVPKFIYCSSMARYGCGRPPFSEDMECLPSDPYGVAKYASEIVIRQLASLNGIKYVIIVPHNIYGPGQNFVDPYRNVIAIMINRMLMGKAPIVYGDGNQRRSFTFIDDIMPALHKIISYDELNGEIINIGPDDEFISINELVDMINEELGTSYQSIHVDKRPLEVSNAYCSSQKLHDLLGDMPKTPIRVGIKRMVEYINRHGPKEFVYNNVPIEIKNDKTPRTWLEQMI